MIDQIITFRYLYAPHIVIRHPRHLVTIVNQKTGKTYVYGCHVLPSDDEMIKNLLPHLAWIDEEYNLTDKPYDPDKYHIIMD